VVLPNFFTVEIIKEHGLDFETKVPRRVTNVVCRVINVVSRDKRSVLVWFHTGFIYFRSKTEFK